MTDTIEYCKENGLRITGNLRVILHALTEARLPLSLQELEQDTKVNAICDRATVYRTLQRLESIGLLRRLNFANSAAKFTLNTGDKHKEYLICRSCGKVEELDIACPVHSLERKISEEKGFSEMSHELTFYGLCSSCQ